MLIYTSNNSDIQNRMLLVDFNQVHLCKINSLLDNMTKGYKLKIYLKENEFVFLDERYSKGWNDKVRKLYWNSLFPFNIVYSNDNDISSYNGLTNIFNNIYILIIDHTISIIGNTIDNDKNIKKYITMEYLRAAIEPMMCSLVCDPKVCGMNNVFKNYEYEKVIL